MRRRGAGKEGMSAVEGVRSLEQAQGLINDIEAKHMFNAFIKSKLRLRRGEN